MPTDHLPQRQMTAARGALISCAVAALCMVHPAQAAYKCKDAAGKVSFQDAPCPDGGGDELTFKPNGPTAGQGPDSNATPFTREANANAVVAEAIRERRPVVGMTAAQLNEAMGLATTINTDQSQGILREQAIFERPNETWYVYTRNGRVESFQNRPGPPLSRWQGHRSDTSRSGACPSAHEIKNAKTAASSISLSPSERNERLHRIRDMENCR